MTLRQRVYRTQAVVLRRFDIGEADRILTLFTLEHGKLRVVAKGVRRPRSRKAGHLEPFTQTDLMLARGRELDIITQAEALDSFPALREDLVSLGHAAYLIELVDSFTVEGGESPALYHHLLHGLQRLAAGDDPARLTRYFELRLLDLVGYRPELFRCVECGKEIRPEDQYFSASAGGVLCPNCGSGNRTARRLSLPVLKVLRHYQRSHYETALAPRIRQEVLAELELLLEEYRNFLLERRLNTPAFLARVHDLQLRKVGAEVVQDDSAE